MTEMSRIAAENASDSASLDSNRSATRSLIPDVEPTHEMDGPDMSLRPRTVAVKQLPELLDSEGWRLFVLELEQSINVARPRLVLDCSNLRKMDRTAIHLLLCCLEEAMKRNGDVRLAGVSQDSRTTLESLGVDSLFQIFDLSSEAVVSFHRRPDDSLLRDFVKDESSKAS